MGYETRMYVGVPYRDGNDVSELIQIRGENCAFSLYHDEKKGGYYYPDGETKRFVSGLKRSSTSFKVVRAMTMMVVFVVDLCKVGSPETSAIIHAGHQSEGPFGCVYASDGNSLIAEDKYGQFMVPIPAREVLEAMKKDNAVEEYRRLTIAIAALEAALKTFSPAEKLQVLFYGH